MAPISVVIVGGGVIGVSAAFHLAEAGGEGVVAGGGGGRGVEMQNRLGVPSRMVSVDEAHELSPLAGLEGVLAGTFCPLAGHATPEGAVQGYASGARANGARIL